MCRGVGMLAYASVCFDYWIGSCSVGSSWIEAVDMWAFFQDDFNGLPIEGFTFNAPA